jgi:hypothetical protein
LKLKEFPTRENSLSYKKEEAKAKRGLRKIKKEYFKKLCKSTNTQASLIFGRKLENVRIRGIAESN